MERGIDVHDWWRRTRRAGSLVLSGRRLVLLVENLPDDSAVMRTWRDGDWSLRQYMDAAAVNELRIMRSELAVFHNRDYREPITIKSPAQQVSDQIDTEQKKLIRQGINAQLYAKVNKRGSDG